MVPYSLLFHFLIFILSVGYSFFKDKKRHEVLKNKLAQEKLETELKLLKSQVNPHFLFNTLNNIYSMVRKHSDPRAAKSIEQLSRLMRYMIYESNTESVLLSREIEYIRDFISLQKMRLPDPDAIKLVENLENISSLRIAPMLLIPFVENACKYGLKSKDGYVEIGISSQNQSLKFKVVNTISNQQVTDSEYFGFGLENVKRRLELIYPDQYSLSISSEENYMVDLQIELTNG